MSRYVLYLSCWLLAISRGSVLTDMSSPDLKAISPKPHPSHPRRPPPSMTSFPTPGVTEVTFNSVTFTSPSTKFHPLPTTTPPAPPATSTTTTTTSTTTVTPVTPTNVSSSIKVFLDRTTKETVPNVQPGVQREWYIRRKHKGPYFEGRVQKLAASLRATEPAPVVNRKLYLGKKTNSSETLPVVRNMSVEHINSAKFSRVYNERTLPTSLHRQNTTNIHSVKPNLKTLASSGRSQTRPTSRGIPASSSVLIHRVSSTSTPSPTLDTYNPPDSDEYYSSYGEYQDLPIPGYNNSGYSEAGVLPDPDSGPEEEPQPSGEDPEVVLPDDSLADTDLHDHDLIDSVMYIYFGSSERDERGAGRQVVEQCQEGNPGLKNPLDISSVDTNPVTGNIL